MEPLITTIMLRFKMTMKVLVFGETKTQRILNHNLPNLVMILGIGGDRDNLYNIYQVDWN